MQKQTRRLGPRERLVAAFNAYNDVLKATCTTSSDHDTCRTHHPYAPFATVCFPSHNSATSGTVSLELVVVPLACLVKPENHDEALTDGRKAYAFLMADLVLDNVLFMIFDDDSELSLDLQGEYRGVMVTSVGKCLFAMKNAASAGKLFGPRDGSGIPCPKALKVCTIHLKVYLYLVCKNGARFQGRANLTRRVLLVLAIAMLLLLPCWCINALDDSFSYTVEVQMVTISRPHAARQSQTKSKFRAVTQGNADIRRLQLHQCESM